MTTKTHTKPTWIYILEHVIPKLDGEDEMKMLGVYSSRQKARDAVKKYKRLPGFKRYPRNFCVSRSEINKMEWAEGFVSMKPPRIASAEA